LKALNSQEGIKSMHQTNEGGRKLAEVWAAVDEFIDHLRSLKVSSPHTIRCYASDIVSFASFLEGQFSSIGHFSWSDVDVTHVRQFVMELSMQGYSKRSIARKISSLRSFFKYLVNKRLIKFNPAIFIRAPKIPMRLPKTLTVSEVEKLLETPDVNTPEGLRDKAILEVLYATGMRVGELVRLNCSDVNLSTGEVIVTGKGGKQRIVLLGEAAIQALNEYISKARETFLSGKTTDALFLGRHGSRLTERQVHRLVVKYSLMAGLKVHVTPHVLRHSFATHMLEGGADIRIVQELLGHASLSTTQIYTRTSRAHLKRIYDLAHPRAK